MQRGTAGRVALAWWRLPWWAQVVLVFAAARVITTLMLLWFAQHQEVNAWTGASPSYADFASLWDGHWYYIVAVSGYPSELPLTDDGQVGENAWAFMPVYPAVVRVVMLVSGAPWAPAAVFVSVACAFASAIVFFKLMRLVLDHCTALFAVVLYSVAPVSPIMQVAYAESMHMLLLAAALYLVMRRNYLGALPVIAVMSFTRPSGLAFALFLWLHVIARFVRRHREPFPMRERALSVGLAVASGLLGLAWPGVAWAVTGSITAYTDTELAWRSSYLGQQHLVPFAPWFQGLDWWATNGLHLSPSWWWGVGGVTVLIGLAAGVLFWAPTRKLGIDLRLWVASYLIYLLAVFFPQSSTFRLLVPIFPLWGAFAGPRSRIYRVSIVILCLFGQIGWILIGWRVDGYDWTPP